MNTSKILSAAIIITNVKPHKWREMQMYINNEEICFPIIIK